MRVTAAICMSSKSVGGSGSGCNMNPRVAASMHDYYNMMHTAGRCSG